jgi:NAD(P)-dependent dehydrogenase (short-subunit alcohol dehydrogenase family)
MKNNRIAIVTGAAKGIGKAISLKLAENCCFICAVDVDEVNGKELINELGKENAKYFSCDIRNETQVKDLFKNVINEFGRIDILVNNAGIIKDNLINKMTLDDFENVIDVNLKGTWLMCREAASIMKTQKSGRIINISSRAWLGNAGQSNYSASKAGIVGLTRVLALELGRYNIFVNAVAPGLIDTPLTQALTPEVREKLIQAQPTKTIGKPEDVANTVVFLSDEKTQFITGQTIYVDGGKSIGANF